VTPEVATLNRTHNLKYPKKDSVSKMSDQTKKPNNYTSEFKESAVKLAVESDQPIAQTARDLGLNPNTLHTWISKYSEPKTTLERTNEHIYDEVKRLKKELARVTQERDLLKKATAYFAKEMQ
jgi:transposase